MAVVNPGPPGPEGGATLGLEQVKAENIAKEAVTEPKALPPTKPALAAENTVKVGAPGVDRTVLANLTGNAVTTAFKIKHALNTASLHVGIATSETEAPNEKTNIKTVKAISAEEVELIFEKAPPKGTTYWVKVTG